jgi:hypothetical protein
MSSLVRLLAVSTALACAGCVYVPGPYYSAYPGYTAYPGAPPPPQQQQQPDAPVAAASPPGPPPNCHEFQETVTIDGEEKQAVGKSCQQPDGSWRIVPTP